MTTHREKRCHHCGVRYNYQSSGNGCQNKVNNDRYCRRCQGEILVTLRKLPIRVKKEWDAVEEPTAEMCVAWEKAWEAEWDHPMLPYCRCISVTLYDMNDPSNRNYVGFVKGRGEFEGKEYRYSTWTKKPENNTVKVSMEHNYETGTRIPWPVHVPDKRMNYGKLEESALPVSPKKEDSE